MMQLPPFEIRAIAVVLAFVLLGASSSVHADADVPLVPSAHVPPRGDASDVVLPAVLGGVLFLGGYLVTAITTTAWHLEGRECVRPYGLAGGWACEDRGPSGDTALASLIPVAGPWVMLNTPGVDAGFAVVMGLTQLAGVLTVALGVPLALRDRRAAVSAGIATRDGGTQVVVSGVF